jgi:uncharacterized protein
MAAGRLRWLVAIFAAVLLLALGTAATAQTFPPQPDGPIYDGADMLSPQTVATLDQRLRDYNRETGHAIIVATVPSLDGQNIEPYATALFAEWGIGGAERDTGLLLLIARDDRKLRIEVGYGLHPWFGGIMSGRVINDIITPRFKDGDFDGGVTQGIDAILAHLANSPEDAVAIAEAEEAARAQQQTEGGFPIGVLIWLGFMFFFFVLPMIGAAAGGKKYRRRGVAGTVGEIILWNAIGSAMSGGGRSSGGWGGGGGSSGGGGFGGFGGGMSGGGGASGSW